MERYDPYTDSFITDENTDFRSYALGYLAGCEDTNKKFQELLKIQFTLPKKPEKFNGVCNTCKFQSILQETGYPCNGCYDKEAYEEKKNE